MAKKKVKTPSKDKAAQFLKELKKGYKYKDTSEYTRLVDALETFIHYGMHEDDEGYWHIVEDETY